MATIDYMVAAYGPYSASATGGNALARDFLAGVAALYSTPSKLSIVTLPTWPTEFSQIFFSFFLLSV